MNISEWIREYEPKDGLQAENALREIMQEVALAGLERSGFFQVAAFYGGTALRIFHGLDRFSEDLDFSLLQNDQSFQIAQYLDAVMTEFNTLGMEVSINTKKKSAVTSIDSAFLKQGTSWNELVLADMPLDWGLAKAPSLKIKIEVDKDPPQGFKTEELLLTRPFSFYVKCFALPDLFAGKMHALLFRKWKQRVKGRDWYDMEWYIRKQIPLHLEHFRLRAVDSEDLENKPLSEKNFRQLLNERIDAITIDAIREDIIRFIPDPKRLDIWSKPYFHDLVKKLRIDTIS